MNVPRWLTGVIGCAALVLTSCSGSKTPLSTATAPPPVVKAETNPRVLILGKWMRAEPGRESETVEFIKDGTMQSASGKGKYQFLDDATIEYEEPKLIGGQQWTKAKVKVTQEDLVLDIVDAKSRADDGAELQPNPDDMERRGKQEKFKRAP